MQASPGLCALVFVAATAAVMFWEHAVLPAALAVLRGPGFAKCGQVRLNINAVADMSLGFACCTTLCREDTPGKEYCS